MPRLQKKNMKLHEVVGSANDHQGWSFRCPGCDEDPNNSGIHFVPDVPQANGGPYWSFDGNINNPTFSPSILTHVYGRNDPRKCHLFVRNGKIEYCGDCYHSMAGKTIDLPDW